MQRRLARSVAGLTLAALLAALPMTTWVRAQTPSEQTAPPSPSDKAKQAIDRGLAWLKAKQNKDHSWGDSDVDQPACTALALKAFVQSGVDPDTDYVDKGFDKLIEFQQKNGGIYKDAPASYNTAIAITALASAPGEAEYKEPLKKAVEYLRSLQWSDKIQGLPNGEGPVDKSDPRFGGWGYGSGKKGRPDGSNLNIALDALHDAGVKPDDPAYQNAVLFATRMQNLSETNKDASWAGDDGGFIYSPANNGMSPAGEYTDSSGKRLVRSYGSMTYAGLKSMIYAGVSKDDPRVKGAWMWVRKNWSLDENPGLKDSDPKLAQAGLFYYFHTMARALRAYGEPVIVDASGKSHDWRLELIDKLKSMQEQDGSWVNSQAKWMEGNRVLCTDFGVLALQEAMADLKDHPAATK